MKSGAFTRGKYRPLNNEGWCAKHEDWVQIVVCDECGALDTKCCIARMCRSFECEVTA
jgi:hypothetical protein